VLDEWFTPYAPDDVIAVLGPMLSDERREKIDAVLAARLGSVTVALENLHDPHNGAAVIRSVEACGLGEIHVAETNERFTFSSKVTQGCEKWVAIHRAPDFDALAARLGERGFLLYAAVPGGTLALEEIDVTRPAALVFGNEHAGLTGSAQRACHGTFGIPMHGFTQSFNLSVSAAVAVHRTAARRREHLGAPGDLDAVAQNRLRARFYALSFEERTARGVLDRKLGHG
jgi:tRNA (guanosine-2'-O-)-methyltransferase